YPRMIEGIYTAVPAQNTVLRRFNTTTHLLEPAQWPSAMAPIRQQLSYHAAPDRTAAGLVVRAIPPAVWDTVPALVIPMPLLLFDQQPGRAEFRMLPGLSYVIVLMDREYITGEMLPALAQQHFRQTEHGFDYQLAVVSAADRRVVYHSTPEFSPQPDAAADAARDLFQVRMQDNAMPSTRTVDVHVAWLRQKIEPNPRHPQYVLTVHGRGYKFVGKSGTREIGKSG